MQQELTKMRYWVGVDGGGTKCRAMIFSEQNQMLGEGLGGPANIAKYGRQALTSIITAVENAVQNAGLVFSEVNGQLHVGAGLAGAFLASSKQLLSDWQHPFARLDYSSDLHTAVLGAHGGLDGAVMITGTGSCAATLKDGHLTQLGGYGFQLGDQGSGAWLGQQAAQRALLVADKLVEDSELWTAVSEFYGCKTQSALVDVLNTALPGEYARFAPRLFELAGEDADAAAIITAGADYLSRLAQRALTDDMKLVTVGGLAALWKPYLSKAVQQRITQAAYGPEWGAVFLARSNLAGKP